MHTTLQVRELTAIIRNQIPAGRKSILDAYGEIAFQAWRNTFGGCRFEVEHTLLQVRPPTEHTGCPCTLS
jgi:condensin-2 complex subunit G2